MSRHPSSFRLRALLVVLGAELLATLGIASYGSWLGWQRAPQEVANRALTHHLKLSSLALWPEASYGRHPCLSDLFTPLSSHPGALEHLPAGSLVPPDRYSPPPRRHEEEP